jgi:hypothetical protein
MARDHNDTSAVTTPRTTIVQVVRIVVSVQMGDRKA